VNFVDIAVLAVIGVSTLFAFSRGFVKELLSILSWVGATIATILLFPKALPYAQEQIADELLAKVAAAVALFVVTLFLLGFINHFISSRVQKSALGPLDRMLGLAFGLVRGIEIVAQARSLPYAALAADFIKSKLPADLLEKGGVILDEGLAAAEKGGAALGVPAKSSDEDKDKVPNQDGQAGNSGYNDAERKDLERLLQGSQSGGQ
jgi:membrane protein required for colicin V production